MGLKIREKAFRRSGFGVDVSIGFVGLIVFTNDHLPGFNLTYFRGWRIFGYRSERGLKGGVVTVLSVG